MKSLKGHLLVASPHLPDTNFFRSVVLLIQYQEEGALGLVLNRPSQNTVQEAIEKVSDLRCAGDELIGVGGPIEGPLMAVHGMLSCSEAEVLPGVYFAAQRENILQIVHQESLPFRVFSGYAGWGSGQLENELKVGGWLTTAANVDYIFHTPADELWKKVTGDIGDRILNQALNMKITPHDPSLN